MNRVYLAGPITGLTHDQARYGWREEFVHLFHTSYIGRPEFFSPMRAKDALIDRGIIESTGNSYGDDPINSEAGIVTRDGNDVRRADVVVACFLEASGRPSLGTAWEMGMCHELHKPVVIIAGPDDPHRKHIILRRMGYIVDSLEAGARVVNYLLFPSL